MERIILLNDMNFPNTFNNVKLTPPQGVTKVDYVEQKIIDAVNIYNEKLKVTKIEYLNIENQFPVFKKGKSNGVLIEEFEIDPQNRETYIKNGCFVTTANNKYICRRIIMYLFVSGTDEVTRTAFVSQVVFPTLLDYASDYLSSPSFDIANHKFCFINILNKTITAKMILRHLTSLCLAEMDYVEVFDNGSINQNLIPLDPKIYLAKYSSKYNDCYNSKTDVYDDVYYRVDFSNKVFFWKTESMIKKIKNKSQNRVAFLGSEEKFYWIETLPMAIFAYKQGFKVDYSEYEDFIAAYNGRFSPADKKFARCQILLNYIRKYFI